MTFWKNNLIRIYRGLTWPTRKATLDKQISRRTVPISILFYHRVANEYPNPWTISESDFENQINWLSNYFDLISLAEVQNRIRSGNDRPAVSITFDDGYAENNSFALPLLIERKIPVTYFVTSYHTTHNKPFPHDMEQGRPLPANSIESLKALANAGVEIGGHTRTHIDLGKMCDQETLYDEVIASIKELETMIGAEIRYFAFPYGQKNNLDPRVFQLLKENHFSGVCSAYGGMNSIHGDAFHLQRIHGDPNLERIKNWLGGDPRVAKVARYDWVAELNQLIPNEKKNGPKQFVTQ